MIENYQSLLSVNILVREHSQYGNVCLLSRSVKEVIQKSKRIFKGVGYGMVMVSFLVYIYYNIGLISRIHFGSNFEFALDV